MADVPTRREINVHDSLDEQCAEKNFFSKSLAEAEVMFRDGGSTVYFEDLMHMGPRAFQFYALAAIAYLLSEEATGDNDGVNEFCGGLEVRLDFEPQTVVPIASDLQYAIERISAEFARYDCEPEIYGDLPQRYRTLSSRIAALA